MTSANVSNSLIQVAPNVSEATKVTENSGKDFMDLMAKSLDVNAELQTSVSTPEAKSSVSVESTKTKIEVKKSETSAQSNVTEEIKEKFSDASEEVKDVIKEALSVTDEEIEETLEALGLVPMDLLDVSNLPAIITGLEGEGDSVDLLLSDTFSDLLKDVSAIVEKTFEEVDLKTEDIDTFINILKTVPQEQAEMPVEANEMVESEEVEVISEIANTNELTDLETSNSLSASEEVVDSTKVVASETLAKPVVEADSKESTEEVSQETVAVEENDVMVKSESKTNDQSFEESDNNEESQLNSNDNATKLVFSKEADAKDSVFANASIQPNQEATFNPVNNEVVLETGETVKVDEIIDQIVERASVTTNNGETTFEMVLNPEGLGKVYVELTSKEGNVSAKLVAENEAVKEALENQMVNLKDNLNSGSAKVTSVEVSVGTHEFERNLEENERGESNQREQMEDNQRQRRTNINLNELDELRGLMSEEEQLVAKIMKENGNTVNYSV